MRTKYLLTVSFLFLSLVLLSQEKNNIALIHSYGDKLLQLRVYPLNARGYQELMNNEYTISRIEINRYSNEAKGNEEALGTIKLPKDASNLVAKTEVYSKYLDEINIGLNNKIDQLINEGKTSTDINNYIEGLSLITNLLPCEEPELAKELGYIFEDNTALFRSAYYYRLRKKNALESDYGLIFKVIVDQNNNADPLISSITESNNKITFNWNIPDQIKDYFVYNIYKSKDNLKFEKLNTRPFLPFFDQYDVTNGEAVFVDSVANYNPHYYYLEGIDYFGNKYKSKVVEAMGIDDIAPAPPTIKYLDIEPDNELTIQWIDEDKSLDASKFIIKQSKDIYGPYSTIKELSYPIGSQESVFELDDIDYSFFQVCKLDTSKNEGCSLGKKLFRIDSIPPAIPTGLIGTVDTSGVLSLSWDQNTEKDLWGYHLYMSHDSLDNFIRITDHPLDTIYFKDTLAIDNLLGNLYFKVSSKDIRGNISNNSQPIMLRRPDKIPPSSPVFFNFLAKEEGNLIKWIPSSFADVEKQIIHRKSQDSKTWVILRETSPDDFEFLDKNVESGKRYGYRVEAIDYSGNRNFTNKDIFVTSFTRTEYPKPISLTAQRNKEGISLSWKIPSYNPDKILLYKKTNEGSLELVRIIDTSLTTLLDTSVEPSSDYAYSIRFEDNNGIKSRYSNLVKI